MINLTVVTIFSYLASFVDFAIFLTFKGWPPANGQMFCIAALLGSLLIDLAVGDKRSFALSRAEASFVALALCYLAIMGVSFIFSSQSDDAVQMLMTRSKAALFMVISVPLFRRSGARNALGVSSIILAVLGSILTIYDFFVPTFSSVPGRGAGFYINPNDTGFMLVALAVVASSRLWVATNYVVWAAVISAVVLTFSRSGWVLLIVALSGQAWLGRLGGGRSRFVFIGSVSMLLGVVFLTYVSGALYDFVASSGLDSYLDPNTVVRLGAYGAAIDDASALERQDALQRGLQAFYSAPIFGHGVGYTNEWDAPYSTHNMYVLFLAEFGLVGFGIFCSLLGVALFSARGEARLLAVLFALASFFSHNMLDWPGTALMLALAISGASAGAGKLVTAASPAAQTSGSRQRRLAF
jgi:O-antigen ligase